MNDLREIPLYQIDADEKFNCRGVISPIDVIDLARDIREKGLLQPVIVMAIENPPPGAKKRYRLIGGFRRFTAHQVNESETIWATVVPRLDEATATIFNISENLNREDLTILQEARAIQRLIELGLSREEIAGKISKSTGWVQIRTWVLQLPEDIQKEVEAGLIRQTDVRDLITVRKAVGGGADGERAMRDAAKKLKEAKEKNVKTSIRPKSKNAKRTRSKVEMNELMDHLFETIGPGFGTRVLAWCAGEISDADLHHSIKEEAEILGKPYVSPY